METVSVIIPTWNRAATIGAAVKSVLEQTHDVLEVLVCDDGSTDNTKEIISAIGDERVKFIEGARAGRPAIPRNRGLAAAKGEWIAFLDSDDVWLEEKIARQLKLAAETKARAVCSNAWRVVPGNEERVRYFSSASDSVRSLGELVTANFVICSSAMVQKPVLNATGGFPEGAEFKAIEDYTLWLRVAAVTPFAYHAGPLVEYRDDPGNSVRAENTTEKEQRERIFRNAWEWARTAEPGVAVNSAVLKKAYKKALRKNGKFLQSFNVT
jgi:teichuronic acid biosynthesis glycosyltransferase TuaG